MTYLVIFSIATILFGFASKNEKRYLALKLNGVYRVHISSVYRIIAICFLSALAGVRASTVGADVTTYVLSSWNRVQNYSSIKDVLKFHNLEIGYEMLEYIISRVSKDVHWLHFFTAVIISGGVSRFSRSFGKKNSFVLSMFVFMCMYFNQSLNIVRQWLAIAIYAGGGYNTFSEKDHSTIFRYA